MLEQEAGSASRRSAARSRFFTRSGPERVHDRTRRGHPADARPADAIPCRPMTERRYVPAAGHGFFLPFYDPMVKLAGGARFVKTLIAQAELQPGHVVLDIGFGTGTLAVAIKCAHPGVTVIGV